MTDYDSNELSVLDDEDQKRSLIARPQASVLPPVAVRPLGIQPQTAQAGTGSTEDLEQKAAKIPAQMGTSLRTAAQPDTPPPLQQRIGQEQNELTRLQSTGSGISQIKNPWARGGARALNIAGEIGSAIIPQIGTALRAIPGTEEHHQRLIGQQENALGADTKEQQQEAVTGHVQQETENLKNPPEKEKPEGATVQTDQGVMQWNPETQRYDINVGGAPQGKKSPIIHETDQGIFMVDPVTREATPLTYQGKPLMPKTGEDKFKAVTLQLPGGGKAAGKTDAQGNLLLADGNPAPKGTVLYQQPNYGQLVLPTKTQTMLGPDNIQHDYSWNPQTQKYDIDQGVSATGAYGHQMEQAGAIDRAAKSLIQTIRGNEKAIDKSKLGEWSTWVKKYGLDTPFADPVLADIQAEYKSFADLNPALHGYRSAESAHSFEQLVGGLQKNPEAAIASIEGLTKTGAHAINPKLENPVGGEANSGKKWNPVSGKYE